MSFASDASSFTEETFLRTGRPADQCEALEGDDLAVALAARGVIYRRHGNIPGFDGIRLRDPDDGEAA
jgi:hypothetical protein